MIFLLLKMLNLSLKPKSQKLAGPGYIILNVLRVCNIVSLLLVAVGSWIMLVKTVQTSNCKSPNACSLLCANFNSLLLRRHVALHHKRYCNLLGRLGAGVLQGLLCKALATTQRGVRTCLPWPRNDYHRFQYTRKFEQGCDQRPKSWSAAVAGGHFRRHPVQGFIFCDRKNHITSRQIRSDGAVAPIDNLNKSSGSFTSKGSSRRPASLVLPSYHETTDNRRRSKFGFILPKRLSKLEISRPVATDPEQFKQWESTSQPVGESRKSPIAPELSRPPTAMHPAYSPSRYSVFSGGSRF
jgi:hypothetical protein